MASGRPIEVTRIAEAEDILAARSAIAELFMDQKVVDYIVDAVRATREPQAVGLPELKPLIAFGASPRASIYLAQAARAHAYLRAGVRGAGGRQGDGVRRAAPPRPADVRGRSRRHERRSSDRAHSGGVGVP